MDKKNVSTQSKMILQEMGLAEDVVQITNKCIALDKSVTDPAAVKKLKAGFDGMLISDHNSYNGYRYWKKNVKDRRFPDFVVLKGIEYDTIDAGHILVIMPENVKLRILELRGLPVQFLIDIVHANGGILGLLIPAGKNI